MILFIIPVLHEFTVLTILHGAMMATVPSHSETKIEKRRLGRRNMCFSCIETIFYRALKAQSDAPSIGLLDLSCSGLIQSKFQLSEDFLHRKHFNLVDWLNMLKAASWQYEIDAVEILQISRSYPSSSRQAMLKLY